MSTQIEEVKKVYLTIGNSDNTEGRGHSVILATSELKETAYRLGIKKYVMGGNCPVEEGIAVKVDGNWYIKGLITKPSKEDEIEHINATNRNNAIEKAKALGMSDSDIAFMQL